MRIDLRILDSFSERVEGEPFTKGQWIALWLLLVLRLPGPPLTQTLATLLPHLQSPLFPALRLEIESQHFRFTLYHPHLICAACTHTAFTLL